MDSKDQGRILEAGLIEKDGTPALVGKILKIAPIGGLFQMVGTSGLKVGETAKIQFKIPPYDTLLEEPVKVIKTYLRLVEPKAGQGYSPDIKANIKLQILEFHFLQLSGHRKTLIENFLNDSDPQT